MATEREVLEEVLKLLKESPALNGGFAKLEQDISDIKASQAEIKEAQTVAKMSQEQLQEDIKRFYKEKTQIYNDLYGPDQGLYQRINDIEDRQEGVASIIGENNENLIELINYKRTAKRMFWVFVTGFVSLSAKFLYDLTQFIT